MSSEVSIVYETTHEPNNGKEEFIIIIMMLCVSY